MTADRDTETQARSEERAVTRVWILTLVIAVGSAVLIAGSPLLGTSLRAAPWWTVVLVALGYSLSERLVFHVEYRNDALTFSISEVPTAFALIFLGPLPALAARLVGSLAVIVPRNRPAPHKLCFNSGLFAVELALAYFVVGAMVGANPGSDIAVVVAVALATGLTTLVSLVGVSAAITCFRGRFFPTLFEELRTASTTAPIATLAAAMAVSPVLLDPRLAPLGRAPIWLMWLVTMQHGRLTQRHRDLESVHDLSRTVNRSLHLDEILADALPSITDALRADRASVVLIDPEGNVAAQHHVGGGVDAGGSPSDPIRIEVAIADAGGQLGTLAVEGRSVAATVFDEADRKRAERYADQRAPTIRNAWLYEAIEHSALHDGLTGALNRRGFDAAVEFRLHSVVDQPGEYAALILDLDRFKEINDTFGHHIGDRVLVEFAERVRSVIEPDDLFGRFGGDEFALFVHRSDPDAVRRLADRIISDSHDALTIDEYQVVVAASVGIAFARPGGEDAAQLIRRSDIAMYAAKRTHVGFETYRSDMDRRTPERLALLADLRRALDGEAITVHYQPKIDIASETVVGAEALVRWEHPTAGNISPADFVRVAEESGLIRQLTDQVLCHAVRSVSEWVAQGFELGVSINLSALDLVDEERVERIESRLDEFDISNEYLTLEITESSLLVDTPRTLATVERLVESGVRLSLDDFGTGYSSLSYLRRLPAQELKVDRSFVSSLMLDQQDEVIVRSTIDLGHHLGMAVVAEGVENEPTLARLAELGCDLGQGYGISRPLPSTHFERWLRTTPYAVRRSDSHHDRIVALR